jgi:hypothetical protein
MPVTQVITKGDWTMVLYCEDTETKIEKATGQIYTKQRRFSK